MKTKKVLAAMLGTTLAFTAALSLAACKKNDENPSVGLGETSEISIANYAVDYTEVYVNSNSGKTGYSTVEKLSANLGDYDVYPYGSYDSTGALLPLRKSDEGSYKYAVYSIVADKIIVSDLSTTPTYITLTTSAGSLSAVRATYYEDYEYTYAYILNDGTTLLAKDAYVGNPSQTILSNVYIDSETETSSVLKLVGALRDGEEVVNYFRIVVDETTGAVSLSKVSASSISTYRADEFGAGASLMSPYYSFDSEEYPIKGDIGKYSYANVGNNVVFYKNNQETGRISLQYLEPVGFVGNYFYYNIVKPVPADATSGYNMYFYDGEVKANYTMFKYDIVENTNTQLNYNVYVSSISQMYNYNAKAYDAANVTCYIPVDGIVYPDGDYLSKETYITDAELHVAFDTTSFSSTRNIYKLDSDKYMIGSTVVNSKLEKLGALSSLSDPTVYGNEQLIKFTKNGYYGFTDFSGKVVIEPKYNGTVTFYDGWACVQERQADGTFKRVLLNKNGSVKDLPDGDNVEVQVYNGIYTVLTVIEHGDDPDTYTFAVYNFEGTLIKSFANLPSRYSASFTTINHNYYIAETVVNELEGGLQETEYNIYKIK